MESLRLRVQELETEVGINLEEMVRRLKSDLSVEWTSIIEAEKQKDSWCRIKSWPKYHIIRSLCTPGRFTHGGDRMSVQARGRQQRAIIAHAEEKARSAVSDADDDTVVQMKTEERTRDEFAADVGLCGNERCRALARRVDTIRPYSNVAEKRRQRNEILARVADTLLLTASTGRDVLVWYLDDILPMTTTDNSDGGGSGSGSGAIAAAATSLTMDLLLRFGGGSGCRLRLFTPNLKRCIVDHVRGLQPLVETGRLVTGVGCICSFNARWASEMRLHGGLDVVMLDGFGGLKHGVLPVLQQIVDLQLFRVAPATRPPPVPLMIVLSDRADRAEHGSVLRAALAMCIEVPRLFHHHGSGTYLFSLDSEEAYGSTMHVLRCSVRDREWARNDLPGVTSAHVVYRVAEAPS